VQEQRESGGKEGRIHVGERDWEEEVECGVEEAGVERSEEKDRSWAV
jgi:hypothetical protein